ncbi:hypothetical protein GCM10009850_107010 [Nonomuraea monospora]|uniref:Uncharacterized protein n=1 Tax=Nonomuraea monospora TaxID=568818 RepID=A0ABN3D0E4_9ACTN
MAVEIDVECHQRPDPGTLARLAGFVMRALLAAPGTEVTVMEEGETWTFHYGDGARVITFLWPPGRHFAVKWYLTFMPGSRGEPVPELLMIILSVTAGLLTDGTLNDDNYPCERTDLHPETMLAQVLKWAPLEPEAAVRLLSTGRP